MSEEAAAPFAAPDGRKRISVRIAQKSDVGLVRTENQDFAILSSPEEPGAADRGRLMLVADGMGGHRGGATASRMAATIIKQEYLASDPSNPPEALRRALQLANARIFQEAQTNPELRGMGTTCSALVIRGEEAWFAHVGDSRIYLVRKDEIHQLTQDHSLVASMVREGLITSQEAEVHPRRNVLQRSMGVIPDVEIDVSPALPVEIGDIFILCSDGLHGLVKELEMKEVVKMPIEKVTAEFVRRALERGAPDNVTVVVARIEPDTGQPLDEPAVDPIPAPPETIQAIPATTEMPLPVTSPEAPGNDITVMQQIELSGAAAELFKAARQGGGVAALQETPVEPEAKPAELPPRSDVIARQGSNTKLMTWILIGVVLLAGLVAVYLISTQDERARTDTAPTTTTQR